MKVYCILFLLLINFKGYTQTIFSPDSIRRTANALRTGIMLKVDGKLDESEWQAASPIAEFFQVEPHQGQNVNFDTEVRLLYNKDFLYIGAYCKDSMGRKSLRVPNFMRDFDDQAHDYFGVSIDGFHDKRNAMVFMTNPYGTQRDLLSFDDRSYDIDWDGLWRVRTQRLDSGWTVEMAIPWQSLRYARTNGKNQSWGINFFRNRRYSNELSSWSPFPRAFSSTRMEYAGTLVGIEPPPPSPNIRVQPYFSCSFDKYNGSEVGYDKSVNYKVGGDVKWAINSNSVLDLTVNTDFAQADVDRQVNNITRLDVFFPERRQFFLENASLFGAGLTPQNYLGAQMRIQPFFSRQIGLVPNPDGTSRPVPIDAGARFVHRSLKRNFGGMLIRQRESIVSSGTEYAVVRYSENIGKQNRIGGIVTVKNTHLSAAAPGYTNVAGAIDGFFRLNQALSFDFMTISTSSFNGTGVGFAGYGQFKYNSNQWVAYWGQSVVTQHYNAEVGFVSRRDVVATTPGFFWINRGKWLPSFVRSFEPGAYTEVYHKASTKKLQEVRMNLNPVWFTMQNGGVIGLFVTPYFEHLDDNDLRPFNLDFASGDYTYTRYSIQVGNDPSKKFSYFLIGETGPYYNGSLNYLSLNLRTSPVPYFSFGVNYEVNQLKDLGKDDFSQSIRLYNFDCRLAINPRVQLISFYQKNSFNDNDAWNVRLAWEFKPLSFLYLVYNRSAYSTTERQQEQHFIGKISYLKQF